MPPTMALQKSLSLALLLLGNHHRQPENENQIDHNGEQGEELLGIAMKPKQYVSLRLDMGNKIAQQQRGSESEQSTKRIVECVGADPVLVRNTIVNHVYHTTGIACSENGMKSGVKDCVKHLAIGRNFPF